ncbi:MAG: hypothetical protein HC837_09855 [Chloroflexaceae bacterium]|nr:hypothetical protein [Chloroflexaceae bacterium]
MLRSFLQQQRMRLLVALLIGLSIFGLRYSGALGARARGDLEWPMVAAQMLVAGEDPYTYKIRMSDGSMAAMYPLTTTLIAAPLAFFPPRLTGALFVGIASALLAFGLTGQRQWWRLLVFVSCPYIVAVQYAQWPILLSAAYFLPWLLPVVIAKPHLGAVVALCGRWSPTTLGITVALVLLSFVLYPTWPFAFLAHTSAYDGAIPLLVLPFGPLLLLLIPYWRNRPTRYLLLLSIVPQRLIYDLMMPLIVARSPRVLLMLTAISWAFALFAAYPDMLWQIAVVGIYGPLAVEAWLIQRSAP